MSALPSVKQALRQVRGAIGSLRTAREYARSVRLDDAVLLRMQALGVELTALQNLSNAIGMAEARRVIARKKRVR